MKAHTLKTSRSLILEPSLDAGLLFLRLAGSFMLAYVHGWPKLMNYSAELRLIEDPLGLGSHITLWSAILAEILCPLLIAIGLFARLACLPIIAVLIVSMFIVHPAWTIAEGQFGWLLLIIFVTIALCGPGRLRMAFSSSPNAVDTTRRQDA